LSIYAIMQTVDSEKGHMMDNQSISKKIREARMARGMTQADLAKQLYKTVSNISAMERGQVKISAENLYEIAQIVDKPIDFFFDQETASTSPAGRNSIFIDLSILPPEEAQKLAELVNSYIALERSTRDSSLTDQQIGESAASYKYLKSNIPAFVSGITSKGEIIKKALFEEQAKQETDPED
jgi:transcriptional regulator with XRE-family HTH domain